MNRILQDYRETGAFQALVSLQSALGDGVFATKSGDLVSLLSLSGPDGDCLDPAERDLTARRFESIARQFDERFRLHHYTLKRTEPMIPSERSSNMVVEEARQKRLSHLQTNALYSMQSYLAVVYEGARPRGKHQSRLARFLAEPGVALRERFSSAVRMDALQHELDRGRVVLQGKVASFAAQVQDFMNVQVLDSQQAYAVFRQLLNYVPYKATGISLRSGSYVDFQLCDSHLECHRDFLRLDDYFVAVLTLKEPPSRTFAHMLRALRELPANCTVATEWQRQDTALMRRLIASKRRHFHNAKASLLNYVGPNSSAAPRDMLIDDSAVALVGNLGACLEEIEVQGRFFGEFSFTIVIHDRDIARLRAAVAYAFKIFAAQDAQLTEETYNRLNAWLAVLPGNAAYNLRRLYLLNTNYVDLSFPFAPAAGQTHNSHLDREYLAILETTAQTPYYLNLHCHDVAHTLILGATGSGKSFLLNFLITHLQKYDPLTYIFDLGGGYQRLTRSFHGRHLSLGAGGLTINPFCLPPTTANLAFLFSFVKVLVESNGYHMTAAEEKDLYDQIETLYSVSADQRRLFTLANIVQRSTREQLQKWVEGGPYGGAFDHAEDTLTFSDFQSYDLEGMDRASPRLEPLLFYVLHRASAALETGRRTDRLACFVLDEAWRFLRHPVIRAYVIEALKTWRKKNAAIVLATQSSADLVATEMLPVIMESCSTQFFLANPGMDQEEYRRAFHLNETEAAQIAGLALRREMLLRQPDGSKILRLDVGECEYRFYKGSAPDNDAMNSSEPAVAFK
jgi:type IV secretion system protein VirB4